MFAQLEDEDRLYLLSLDEDDADQCIRLLSFCKKHRQPSNDRMVTDERVGRIPRRCSDYIPPCNPSGCARTGTLFCILVWFYLQYYKANYFVKYLFPTLWLMCVQWHVCEPFTHLHSLSSMPSFGLCFRSLSWQQSFIWTVNNFGCI
jgi:hypothetical protein